MEFEPSFPRTVNALLPTNVDYIGQRSAGYEHGMFADQHGAYDALQVKDDGLAQPKRWLKAALSSH
jgi:hypothetical protein